MRVCAVMLVNDLNMTVSSGQQVNSEHVEKKLQLSLVFYQQ